MYHIVFGAPLMVQQLRICLQCRRCRFDPWVWDIPWKRALKPLDESERGEWKSWLKAQHSENEDHGIWSHHFMGNRWGNNGNSKTKGKLHCKWESCIFKCFLVQIFKSSYLPASFSLVKKQMERLMRSAFSMKALWISGRHGRKFQEAAELAISLPYLQCTGTSKQPTSEGKGQGCSSYRDPLARKDRLSPIACVLFCISKIQYRAQEIFIFK